MFQKIKKISNNEFVRGGFFVTLSFTISNVLNLLYTIFAGRRLGPIGYGDVTALLSYINIISVPMAIIVTVIIQKVSEADEKAPEVASSIEQFFWSSAKRYWFLIVPTFFFFPFIPGLTNLTPLAAKYLFPMVWITFIFLVYSAFLQGMKVFFIYSVITVLSAIIKLAGPFVSMYTGQYLFVVLTFLFLSYCIPFIFSFKAYKDNLKKSSLTPRFIERSILRIISQKQFIITAISIVGITFFSNFDIIFVKKFYSASSAGIYSSWSLLAKTIYYLIGPISTVTFILFSSKKQENNHTKAMISSVLFFLGIGFSFFIFYTVFSTFTVNVLFGHSFFAVLPFMGMASIYGTLYSLITHVNYYHMARKSNCALILPVMMIVYAVWLFLFAHSLKNIMTINIYFSIVVLGIYLIYYLKVKQTTR